MALQWAEYSQLRDYSPAGVFASRRGFLVPANGLRGSRGGAAAFEALSCGRDRVRWPCCWLAPEHPRPAVEPVVLTAIVGAAGSLVLRRMDRRGHKRGLVRAKKHGTESGSGAPLRRGVPGS